MTNIQWTEQVWNPTTGCDRVSDGCLNCYALTMAKRLKGMGSAKYQTDGDPRTSGPGFGFAMHADTIREPLRWKKPRKVFVNSMSDLFHAGNPDANLHLIFGVMAATPQHTYQILTKRHGRMRSLLNNPQFAHMVRHRAEAVYGRAPEAGWTWPLPNVHLGVSVENQQWADIRIPALLGTPAVVRFLSCEPMVGPVDLGGVLRSDLYRCACGAWEWDGDKHPLCADCGRSWTWKPGASAIDWVIIGGESGPGARPFHPDWAAALIKDSRAAGAAPFVKQLGSVWARENNASDAKGGKPADWPEDLRVREYPASP
ncbi:phage Gp37/Gp68 family protein [Streptomyces sp. NPDC056227]|uniref:phage Gp37/Gp68 family protein n=1 Tax=Streptomyces sp. NPDC056227 TaxID=3345753 RepID=UPI0035DB8B28